MNRLEGIRSFFRRLPRGGSSSLLLGAVAILNACVPPGEPETEVQEQEPVADGAIPWAPGEAPSSAEETTREVAPEPKKHEMTEVYYEEDGVQETNSGHACSGKAPPALRASVDVRAHETGECSKKIPPDQAGAAGDMKVSVRVAKTGKVESVEILSDTLGVSEVTSCVNESLAKPFTDAHPRGGCTIFVLPLHFESAPVEAAEEESAAESESDAD